MEERICADCGRRFVLNDMEIQSYVDKGQHLPRRCLQCRLENNGEEDIDVYYETTERINKNPHPPKQNFQKTIIKRRYNHKAIIITSFLFLVSILLSCFVGYAEVFSLGYVFAANIVLFILMCISFIPKKEIHKVQPIEKDESLVENTSEKPERLVVKRQVPLNTQIYEYKFGSNRKLLEHYEKHGKELFCRNIKEYLDKANGFINRKKVMKKINSYTGEISFYSNCTMEFAKISKEGHIETYFKADRDYFDRQ